MQSRRKADLQLFFEHTRSRALPGCLHAIGPPQRYTAPDQRGSLLHESHLKQQPLLGREGGALLAPPRRASPAPLVPGAPPVCRALLPGSHFAPDLLAAESRAKMDHSLVCMFPLQLEEDGTLLFIEEEGLESDSFQRTGKCQEAQILRNIENRVLMAQPTDQTDAATFESITYREMDKASGVRFTIHSYRDTMPRGFPVAFSTQCNSTTYYMYVERRGDQMRVAFKQGNLPNNITGATSDILFFKMPFSRGSKQYYMFESTLEQDHFLAFEKDKATDTSRLIVKKTKAKEMVDESTKLHHAPV